MWLLIIGIAIFYLLFILSHIFILLIIIIYVLFGFLLYLFSIIFNFLSFDELLLNSSLLSSIIIATQTSQLKNYNSTALVLYDNNRLGSSIGSSIWKKNVRSIFELTPLIKSVIIGLILSDGWFMHGSTPNGNSRIALKLKFPGSFELFWTIFNILSPILLKLPLLVIGNRKGTITRALQLTTMGLPEITALDKIFYNSKNIKIIPDNIFHLLDPIVLAFWIMCDGEAQISGLRLCTDSFTVFDVVLLMNVLIIKFNLNCRIHWKKSLDGELHPRIYFPSSEMDKLRLLVKPYFVPSFLYKIDKKVNKYYIKKQNK